MILVCDDFYCYLFNIRFNARFNTPLLPFFIFLGRYVGCLISAVIVFAFARFTFSGGDFRLAGLSG